MSRPIVVAAGPIIAASTTKIALAQAPGAAGALALNGASGVFTANSISLSQTVSGAAVVLLNGALGPSPAVLDGVTGIGPIYITSAGNDSGITFAIVGRNIYGATLTETLTGVNASVVASTNSYYS